MVSLTEIKKSWPLFLLTPLALILFTFWLLIQTAKPSPQSTTTPLPTIASLPGEEISPRTQVTINFQPEKKNAKVIKITRKTPISSFDMSNIANTLGFSGEPFVVQDALEGPVYSWDNKGLALTITPNKHAIRLHQDLILSPITRTGQLPLIEEAENKLLSLIQQIGLALPEGSVTGSRYSKFKGYTPVSAEAKNADITETSITLSHNNIPIVDQNPQMSLAKAWLDKSGKIIKFEWKNPIETIADGNEYRLKNLSEIEKTLLSEGKIALIDDGDLTAPRSESLTSINILNYTLAYFLSPDLEKLVQPIFVFEGNYKKDNQKGRVVIYLPALKPTQP